MVVDFSVEDEDEAAVMGELRLMSRVRQIHDRQPPKAEAYADRLVDPRSRIVGSAVAERIRHIANDSAQLFPPFLSG